MIVEQPIRYEDIFASRAASLGELRGNLERLPKIELILRVAQINLLITRFGHDKNFADEAMKRFCSPEQRRKIAKAASRYRGSADYPSSICLFHRGQLLELLRWSVLFASDVEPSINSFSGQDRFLRAALLAGKFFHERTQPTLSFKTHRTDEDRLSALIELAASGAWDEPNEDNIQRMSRAWYVLYDRLLNRKPDYRTEFENQVGMSAKEYYQTALSMVLQLRKARDPSIEIDDFADSRQPSLQLFLTSESQTVTNYRDSLAGHADQIEQNVNSEIGTLRTKCIFQIGEDNYLVPDVTLLTDRVVKGPVFSLSKRFGTSVFSEFGYVFEDYVLDELEHVLQPEKSTTLVSAADKDVQIIRRPMAMDGNSRVELCDGAILIGQHLFLVEAKNCLIRDSIVMGNSAEMYLEALRSKYGVSEADNKGLGQLGSSIQKVLKGSRKPLDQILCPEHWNCIYPLLIVNDEQLGSGDHQWFLSREFEKQLSTPRSGSGYDLYGKRIKPLTVLTPQSLIWLEMFCRYMTLHSILDKYIFNFDFERPIPFQSHLGTLMSNNLPRRHVRSGVIPEPVVEVLNEVGWD